MTKRKTIDPEIISKLKDEQWLRQKIINEHYSCSRLAKELGTTRTTVEKYRVLHKIEQSLSQKELTTVNYQHKKQQDKESILEKRKQTNLKRYGVENPFQSEEKKQKSKQTMMLKYGVEHPLQSDEIQRKREQTTYEKYGRRSYAQQHIDPSILTLLDDKCWLTDQHHSQKKTILQISKEVGVSPSTVNNALVRAQVDVRYYYESSQQREISDWLRSLDITVQTGVRDIIGGELDIVLPDYNLAIEYNGLFWHSEINLKQSYHLNKTIQCEQKGIRLIHIMEDEWRDRQQQCKDTILHLLGRSIQGDFARKCAIREIDWTTARNFLDQYHLLGAGTSGSYRIGAYNNNDELIGVMVFGQKTNEGSSRGTVELKRFVTNKKNNPGLGTKMFKYAVQHQQYNKVVAFVDRRWFTGLVKHFIGFEQIGTTPPAVWWTDGNVRLHRRFITKKQLSGIGSKRQQLLERGFYRIWDCGKIKLEWTRR